MDKNQMIKHVELILDHQISGFGLVGMTPKTEKNKTYTDDLDKIDHEDFLKYAYKNYIIFRFLCKYNFAQYPFFLGQQCVENYLKAYIKFKKGGHVNSHNLEDLLEKAQNIDKEKENAFIHSKRIDYIIKCFDAYYEVTRYPVAKAKKLSKDKNGIIQLGYMHPERTWILDYFVYKMRKIVPKFKESDDIFKNKLPIDLLILGNNDEDKIWKIIKEDNINFM